MLIPKIKPITRKRQAQLKRDFGDPKYREWRDKVLARDAHSCQFPSCGKKTKLEIHHIKRFTDAKHLKLEVWNGITLCDKCHKKIYGKEKKYEMFFYQIIDAKMKKDK